MFNLVYKSNNVLVIVQIILYVLQHKNAGIKRIIQVIIRFVPPLSALYVARRSNGAGRIRFTDM
jgi:hypothetical protein